MVEISEEHIAVLDLAARSLTRRSTKERDRDEVHWMLEDAQDLSDLARCLRRRMWPLARAVLIYIDPALRDLIPEAVKDRLRLERI